MSKQLLKPDWFCRPGESVVMLMRRRGITKSQLATLMDCHKSTVSLIINGSMQIDEDIAFKLSMNIGGTPQFWISRQALYNQCLEQALGSISNNNYHEWIKIFPKGDMIKNGFLKDSRKKNDIARCLLGFFGSKNIEEWEENYTFESKNTSFRTSPTFSSDRGSLSAWLRQAEIEASIIPCLPWDVNQLKNKLHELRRLSLIKSPSYFLPRIQKICSSAGIAVVFVPSIKGCKASGAAKFLSSDKAMIALSFRYKSEDQFWFTLFHEIGHLILHGENATYIDDDRTDLVQIEQEANLFAESLLIPQERYEEFIDLPPSKEKIMKFAVSIGVSAGIIVGQLQHKGALDLNQFNFLKRRYNLEEIFDAIP